MSAAALPPRRRTEPWLLLFARICFASLFLPDGVRKFMTIDGFAQGLAHQGMPMPDILAWLAAFAETAGALGVLLGFRTTLSSVLLIAFTVAATAIAHRFWNFAGPERIRSSLQFFHNCALVGALTLLILRGPGPVSLDRTP